MKLNFLRAIIALAVSFLISYGLYSIHDSDNIILLSIGNLIFLATTLVFSIGISFERPRSTINIRVVSFFFFVIALASNLIFSITNFSAPSYVITNGILLLIFVLIVYSINKAKQ